MGPNDEPWPDWTGRAKVGGRSAYTSPDWASVRSASDGRAFARAFQRRVNVPDADALSTRAMEVGVQAWWQRLGLANRAGALSVGQAAARDGARGDAGLTIVAEDAGSSASKFAQNARRKSVPVAWALGAEMGRALGREFVSVAIVARSPFSEQLTAWAAALGTYPDSGVRLESETDETVDRGQRRADVV